MKSFSFLLFSFLLTTTLFSQKKPLDLQDYDDWNSIRSSQITKNGNMISYHVVPNKGDQIFHLVDNIGSSIFTYERAENASWSWDDKYIGFRIKPAMDSVREMKREKVKKKDLPKDTLGIYAVEKGSLVKKAPIKSYQMPQEWSAYLFYTLDEYSPPKDTSKAAKEAESETEKKKEEGEAKEEKKKAKAKKAKKVSKNNGYHLVVHHLESGTEDTIHYVKSYQLAKSSAGVVFETSGIDSTYEEGIYFYNPITKDKKSLLVGKYKYKQLRISEDATQIAFLADLDSTKALLRNHQLFYWNTDMPDAESRLDASDLAQDWMISEHGSLSFSEDGKRLFFGTAPNPMLQDTNLLPDEIIQVEVWSYQDERLQTMQEKTKSRDQKKTYWSLYYPKTGQFFQLANKTIPNGRFAAGNRRVEQFALGTDNTHYQKASSWEGGSKNDIYAINLENGEKDLVAKGVRGFPAISPSTKYIYWFNAEDTAYFAYHTETKKTREISQYINTSLVNELDDHPNYAPAYRIAGWTENDQYILIYDRFDIWKVNPQNPADTERLTNGREKMDRYRVRNLDPEQHFIDLNNMLCHVFNEESRNEGYTLFKNGKTKSLIQGDFRLGSLRKAKDADQFIFTKQSNSKFPDIVCSGNDFNNSSQLSDANPQQKDRNWSTVELVSWNSLNGDRLEGLVYKPEDFDPGKKYPMITYFYERSSQNMNRYWGATPIRSIINPNYYASRGYVVFVPDIIYRDGYPGESCYNAVIPGVTYMIDQGYIDRDRIGVQGHSWGGYQIAYLVTKTDIFKCAESGAPVVNMVSAYGGIRWGTGMSRMFQYEKTQSRIGGTLWEYPLRYLENSPIFFIDKINTPLLIMHNDQDSAVPWYQGIEFFVALRRLNKPGWMLNYNNEPHWPTKRENIIDFNIRMQQFFDHYLMDQPMPVWMAKGIPAVHKGIDKGYKLMEK